MKTALVTGANKGIGFEVSKRLAQSGYFVYLGCRNNENGTSAVEKLRADGINNIEAVTLDVTSSESTDAARSHIGHKTERLDVLINNAGILGGFPQSALEAGIDQYKTVYETNLFGVARVTQAFIDLLKKSPEPRIVNVTSSMGSLNLADINGALYHTKYALYQTSKSALNMYTINLAYELRDTAFKVNAVCPGYTKTDFTNQLGTGTAEEAAQRVAKYAMIGQDGPTGKFICEEIYPETSVCPW
jgi:NAD(P)-dependent dehydrogenase (short-subunit alcohol dehydrogenase family)